jgi:hypothetical protein
MGECIVEFTRLEDCIEKLGDPRMVLAYSGCDSLTWGVALGFHILSGPVVYFTYWGTAGVGSTTNFVEVISKSCSSMVNPILIIYSKFSPSHLLSLEL